MLALRDRSRLAPISSLDSGDFSGHGRGAGEVSRAWGEVAAGVRVIVSRAGFRGPGWALRESFLGHSSRRRQTSDRVRRGPILSPIPVRRCARGSRHPTYPELSRVSKPLIDGSGALIDQLLRERGPRALHVRHRIGADHPAIVLREFFPERGGRLRLEIPQLVRGAPLEGQRRPGVTQCRGDTRIPVDHRQDRSADMPKVSET